MDIQKSHRFDADASGTVALAFFAIVFTKRTLRKLWLCVNLQPFSFG